MSTNKIDAIYIQNHMVNEKGILAGNNNKFINIENDNDLLLCIKKDISKEEIKNIILEFQNSEKYFSDPLNSILSYLLNNKLSINSLVGKPIKVGNEYHYISIHQDVNTFFNNNIIFLIKQEDKSVSDKENYFLNDNPFILQEIEEIDDSLYIKKNNRSIKIVDDDLFISFYLNVSKSKEYNNLYNLVINNIDENIYNLLFSSSIFECEVFQLDDDKKINKPKINFNINPLIVIRRIKKNTYQFF